MGFHNEQRVLSYTAETETEPGHGSEILTNRSFYIHLAGPLSAQVSLLLVSFSFPATEVTFAGFLLSALQVRHCTILVAPFIADVAVLKPTELLVTFSGRLQKGK